MDSLKALKKVMAENVNKEAKAQAALALGMLLKSHVVLAPQVQKADTKALPKWEEIFGKELVAALKKADPDGNAHTKGGRFGH